MYTNPSTPREFDYEMENEDGLDLVNSIVDHMREMTKFSETDADNDYVAVGGIALHQYMREKNNYPMELTKDGDIVVDYSSYTMIRDLYEVEQNPRLGKAEYKIGEPQTKHHTDIDLYLPYNKNTNLEISAHDLINDSKVVGGVRCIDKVHLLALKLDKYRDFTGSHESQKYNKMVKDNLQILSLLDSDDIGGKIWDKVMTHERMNNLSKNLNHAEIRSEVEEFHSGSKEKIEINLKLISNKMNVQLRQFKNGQTNLSM